MGAKYFGVTLSNDLEWLQHIATMANKANSKLSFLRRNRKGCPDKFNQTSYVYLIRSFMEYGTTVWEPYKNYNSDKVGRVQRRASRLVESMYTRYCSVSDMLDTLGWPTLPQRRYGGSNYWLQTTPPTSGHNLLCKLCRTFPPPAMGTRFTVFLGKPAMRTRWMAGAASHKSG